MKSIPTYVVLLRSYCVRKVENSALQHVLYVCAVLPEQDTLQGVLGLLETSFITWNNTGKQPVNSAMLWCHPSGRVFACPCGLAEAPWSVYCSGRTAHRARVLRLNFPPFGHNNFSTRQSRWEWTSPLFFWDQARVKWHITCRPSHLKFLQDGGRGTHVTHFVQLYPQPLYTASKVRTTSRSWDKGVLTDLCLTRVLTDLCLTRVLTDLCLTLYICR